MNIKTSIKFIIALIIPQLAGIVGSIFTTSSLSTWYQALTKPEINPPNWVFAPVWTTLFFLMGLSLFLVWQKGFRLKIVKTASIVFAVQLGLNILWSILFFGLESPFLALVEIVVLWLSIVANILVFYNISKTAGLLLLPYLAWVSFATYLNYLIWILN